MAWLDAAQRTAFVRTFLLAFAWLLVVRVLLIIQSGVVPSMPGMLGGDLPGVSQYHDLEPIVELDGLAPETRLVAQLDVPPTILDATGHAQAAGNIIGRSLLVKEPDSVRDLILADTYTGMKYFLRESGQLLACTEMMTRCQSWSFDPERLFGSLTLNEDEPFLGLDDRLALVETANNLGIAKP